MKQLFTLSCQSLFKIRTAKKTHQQYWLNAVKSFLFNAKITVIILFHSFSVDETSIIDFLYSLLFAIISPAPSTFVFKIKFINSQMYEICVWTRTENWLKLLNFIFISAKISVENGPKSIIYSLRSKHKVEWKNPRRTIYIRFQWLKRTGIKKKYCWME